MAVADKVSSSLRLVLYDGDDTMTGEPMYKYKSFNNVKTEAVADQLLPIAEAVAALQERPLYNIERRDNSEIREG
ncbi:DUF1659 domain-containing protein [Virgibacillus sp. NKC19-16]|uniref:DUF1659 domain-containing protein n=1 Tax=Virgibacillus salidurans TaxID=2831673 RepID=UPI001F15935C|nr:DUF1659 domain-containing protein [Virgibacillus sp. NKC19-16]UJL45863.1 DUF1659 domain-containing protein [Virgibacillus sp. NKC19-16]